MSTSIFDEDTDFSEVAYTSPELAVADKKDPYTSAQDATVKCVYTDNDFYALIVSATDPEHGLADMDGYELVDHKGRPYDALPEGKYQIQVTLSYADGKELAFASKEMEIGRKSGTVIHEITTETAIKNVGMDLLTAWASDENLTILGDFLPGFFGPYYQMSTIADGSNPFSIKKDVGVRRIDEPEGESDPALYEFYNVFPENTLKAGNSYDITVQIYDRNGMAIKGAACKFTLNT